MESMVVKKNSLLLTRDNLFSTSQKEIGIILDFSLEGVLIGFEILHLGYDVGIGNVISFVDSLKKVRGNYDEDCDALAIDIDLTTSRSADQKAIEGVVGLSSDGQIAYIRAEW